MFLPVRCLWTSIISTIIACNYFFTQNHFCYVFQTDTIRKSNASFLWFYTLFVLAHPASSIQKLMITYFIHGISVLSSYSLSLRARKLKIETEKGIVNLLLAVRLALIFSQCALS